MSTPAENLEQLKALVAKLQSKVERLESQIGQEAQSAVAAVKDAVGISPAQTLRLVLMGPPGAGTSERVGHFPGRVCAGPPRQERYDRSG